jgi:glycosyltransferase involved in cell wall biosynthesis
MNVWIATEFYEPYSENPIGHFVKGIAEKLSKKSYVHVILPGKQLQSQNNGNLRFYHVFRLKFNRKNLIFRTMGQLIISMQFFFLLLLKAKNNDTVICFTQPAFFLLFCVLLKKIRNVKLVIVNHDLFPEVLTGTGVIKNTRFYRLILQVFNSAYRHFDSIISIGDDMTEVLKGKLLKDKSKVVTIPNWADTDEMFFHDKKENLIIIKYGLETRIVFSSAGNIGRAQGIDKLLYLISHINQAANIHFLFFGKGVLLDSFLEFKKNRNAELITYAGYLPEEDKYLIPNACDVAIVTLLDEMKGFAVPSKTYNILASGHPILYLGNADSEIGKMVCRHEIGWVCSLTDIDLFQNIIDEILTNPSVIRVKGEKARYVAEKFYSKAFILNKYADTLNL